MVMKTTISMLIVLCVLIGSAVAASTMQQTIVLGSTDVTMFTPQDTTLGPQYVLTFGVPQTITSEAFVGAVLEFYADVSAATVNGWQNDTPVVEVYVLNSAATAAVTDNQLRKPSGMIRNVVSGDDTRVRIDISEAVRYFLENPSSNCGLVVGSFRGGKEGRFAFEANPTNSNSMAEITFFCR
jgi:hypothetical protein